MLNELIQSIIVASAGLFSVGSIIVTILLLLSERGKLKGLAYVLGYSISYSLIGIAIIVLGISSDSNKATEPSLVFPVILIVFGTLLLFLSLRNWRKSKQDSKSSLFASLDKMSPSKAFMTGVLVSMLNVKNLMLFLSAISIVYLSSYNLAFKIINVLLVVFVFCFAVILPVMISFVFPAKSMKILEGFKNTLERNSYTISIAVPFVFGLLFVINGILKIV